jgi:hypothetical protein
VEALILSPIYSSLETRTAFAMAELLHKHGFGMIRDVGCSQLDIARSRLAASALSQSAVEWFLWIDADIVFEPLDAIEMLARARQHNCLVVGADYPTKQKSASRSTVVLDGTLHTNCPTLARAWRMGFGFVLTHRTVFERLKGQVPLAIVGDDLIRPYFAPLILGLGSSAPTYYSEDYAFCERVRSTGVELWNDTAVNLGHVGPYLYEASDMKEKK